MAETQPKAPPVPPGLEEDVLGIYKRVFFRGLATLLPTLLTLWVLVSVYGFIDERIANPIASAIKGRLVASETGNKIADALFDFTDKRDLQPIPQDGSVDAKLKEEDRKLRLRSLIDQRFPSWIGFLLAIVGVFMVGFLAASFVGRTAWRLFEDRLDHIPIVKSVYPGAKQMVEFLLKSEESRRSWSTVVAVEYPRKGIWAIGYITGPGIQKIEERHGGPLRTVFLPASPTMAGYVIMVPEHEIVPLDMTVDDAIKFTISGGVVRPTQKSASERLRAVAP